MIILNGAVITPRKFPNGEFNLNTRLINESLAVNLRDESIIFKFESHDDLFLLYFIKKFIDDNYTGQNKKYVNLLIKYLPYSRMDRVYNDNQVFTLKYITDFINSLEFNKVTVIDCHSDVGLALLNRSRREDSFHYEVLTNLKYTRQFNTEKDYILFPDSGAAKKYSYLEGNCKFKALTASKHRDFDTGKITSLSIMKNDEEIINKDAKCFIVDDICSYGNTFILGARELRKMGFKEVYLIVTHCELSVFNNILNIKEVINGIYTTDSIISREDIGEKPDHKEFFTIV